jgi:hypothetical protein
MTYRYIQPPLLRTLPYFTTTGVPCFGNHIVSVETHVHAKSNVRCGVVTYPLLPFTVQIDTIDGVTAALEGSRPFAEPSCATGPTARSSDRP